MVGQLKYTAGVRGKREWGRLYGLPVLRFETDPAGPWGVRRIRQAGKTFWRGGVAQTLVPKGFDRWPLLEPYQLVPVDPLPLIRAQADGLAMEWMRRQGIAAERAIVALRGERADRDMARAAVVLCQRVRRLVISAPRGGEELALQLRREFGVPILPPEERGTVGIWFAHPAAGEDQTRLKLYGTNPDLGGMTLFAPVLEGEDRTDLPLMTALWQSGRLGKGDLKIT